MEEDLKLIMNFVKDVYEFFKTDFICINDFLKEKSPWDTNFLFRFNIDNKELKSLKDSMIKSIVETYYQNIIGNVILTNKVNIVDKNFLDELTEGKSPESIFLENKECFIIMHRFFLATLEPKVKIMKDTYYYYENNINYLIDLYHQLYNDNNGDDINESNMESEIIYNTIHKKLYTEMVKYFQKSFRTIEEESNFLNYLYSMVYAYLCYVKENEDYLEGVEYGIMSIIENNINVRESFYYNSEVACCVIECLCAMYDNLGKNYDMRKAIDDTNIQKKFSSLDPNYENEFKAIIMVSDSSFDRKLENVLSTLENYNQDNSVYDILIKDDNIYDLLFDNDIEPRYQSYIKELLIGKVLGDIYAFEVYNHNQKGAKMEQEHYQDIKKVMSDKQLKFNYFLEKGKELLDLYYAYHMLGRDIEAEVDDYLINSGEVKTVTEINPFITSRFVTKEITPLPSVDFINKMLSISKNSDNILDLLNTMNQNEAMQLLKVMCLSVYEHLILEKDKSEYMINLINMLENEKDIVSFLRHNEDILISIIKLFNIYNPEEISYNEEITLRMNIKSKKYAKILERLNPFEEEEKSSKH